MFGQPHTIFPQTRHSIWTFLSSSRCIHLFPSQQSFHCVFDSSRICNTIECSYKSITLRPRPCLSHHTDCLGFHSLVRLGETTKWLFDSCSFMVQHLVDNGAARRDETQDLHNVRRHDMIPGQMTRPHATRKTLLYCADYPCTTRTTGTTRSNQYYLC